MILSVKFSGDTAIVGITPGTSVVVGFVVAVGLGDGVAVGDSVAVGVGVAVGCIQFNTILAVAFCGRILYCFPSISFQIPTKLHFCVPDLYGVLITLKFLQPESMVAI